MRVCDGFNSRAFGEVLLKPTYVGEIKFFRISAALIEKSAYRTVIYGFGIQ